MVIVYNGLLSFFLDIVASDWLAPVSGDYNMQVVAIVEALGYDAAGSDHMLIALNDDEIIGLAQGSSFSDFWIYNMSLFSNENNLNFDFYSMTITLNEFFL